MDKYEVLNTLKGEVDKLPSLPHVVTRVIQITNSPTSSADEVAKLIENDISMGGQILKLANSSYYGIPKTIASIRNAIVILGFDTIRSLILSANMVKIFPEEVGEKFSAAHFWGHCVTTAILSRSIVNKYNLPIDKEQAFTAGLLHDVGRLLLLQVFPSDFNKVIDRVSTGMSWEEAEKEVFSITSMEASEVILGLWNIPQSVRTPICNRATPEEYKDSLAWVLHLADYLSTSNKASVIANEPVSELSEVAEDFFQEEIEAKELLEEFKEDLESAQSFIELFGA
jgi:HD-like signal output (HDOD) protein